MSKESWAFADWGVLKVLEEESDLTIEQLLMRFNMLLPDDLSPYNKVVERALKTFAPLVEKKKRKKYSLLSRNDENFGKALISCLHIWLMQAKMNYCIFGEMDARKLRKTLDNHKKPVDFLFQLGHALRFGHAFSFEYQPQTIESHRKWSFRSNRPHPVRILIHRLVFSVDKFILLGEWTGSNPQLRQYNVAGIANYKVQNAYLSKIPNLDVDGIYQNSVDIWLGGEIHEVTLEIVDPSCSDPSKMKQEIRKVNGEKEIISYLLASLGMVRLIDPPDALVKAAKDYVTEDMMKVIFRYSKDGSRK